MGGTLFSVGQGEWEHMGHFFGGWGWVRKNFGWVDWVGVGEDE